MDREKIILTDRSIGVCFCANKVVEIAKTIQTSKRGKLSVSILDRGTAWLDNGAFPSLIQASQFVQVIEERQGLKVNAIEEAAFRSGFINKEQLQELAKPLLKSGYGKYLMEI